MITPDQIVKILNDLTNKDNKSMLAILSYLHPTNNEVLKDYEVQMKRHDYPQLGILTILNKVLEDSGKKIRPLYSVDSFTGVFDLEGFTLEDR